MKEFKGPIRAANPGDDAIEVTRNHGKPTRASELAKALADARKKGQPLKVKGADGEMVEAKQAAAPASPPAIPAVDAIAKLEHDAKAAIPMPKAKPGKPAKQPPQPEPAAPAKPAPAAPVPAAVPKFAADAAPKPAKPAPAKPEPERPVRVFGKTPPPKHEEEKPVRVFEKDAPEPAPEPEKRTKPAKKSAQLRFVGMKPMHVVEAALFAAGKPILVEEIVETTGLREADVKAGIAELVKEYASRDTVLEVGKAGTKWGMAVKSQASEPAAKFAPMEIPAKTLKTLALIAFHQPLKQSVLVDMVGSKAYDHVHELHERGLVKAHEEGVTKILRTTSLFPEYFGLDAATPEEIRATMAKLVGLDPSKLEKPAEPKVVYEETQEPAEAKPEAAEAAEAAETVAATTPTAS